MIRQLFDRSWIRGKLRATARRVSEWARRRRDRLAVIRRDQRWFSLGFACEPLEIRKMLAVFSYDGGTDTLTIDLDQTGEEITIVSEGGGNYTFTLSGGNVFNGTDQAGLSGNTTDTLTVNSTLVLTDITITDSNTATAVKFGASTGGVVDNLSILLNNTPGDVTVVNATEFAGTAVLSAEAGNINLDNDLTMDTGSLTLVASVGEVAGTGTATADNLSVTAATGLNITTNVASFDAVSTTGGDIVINQTGDIDLPDITAPAAITITATGNISQAGGFTSVIATGAATFNFGDNLTLDGVNDFKGSISVNTNGSGEIQVNDSFATLIAASNIGTGNFTLTTTGAVTQSAAIVQAAGAGAFSVLTGGAEINLSNATNNFTGAVYLTNANTRAIQLRDVDAVVLGYINQQQNKAGTLAVTAGGDITQLPGTGIVTGTGGATFTGANGTSVLLGQSNQFNGQITFSPNKGPTNQLRDITLVSSAGIEIQSDLAISGNLALTAGGNITDAGNVSVGGTTTLSSSAVDKSIILDGNNTFTGAVSLDVFGGSSAVNLANVQGNLTLGSVSVPGSLSLTAADSITDTSGVVVGGTASFTVSGGGLSLDAAGSSFGGPLSIVANGDVAISNVSSAIDLGSVQAGGNLAVAAPLAITNSGTLNITGSSSFTTTGNNAGIALNATAGVANSTFGGLVSFVADGAGSASLINVDGSLGIDTATFGGTFTITASGTITLDASGGGLTGTGLAGARLISLTSTGADVVLNQAIVSGGGNVKLTATVGTSPACRW